MTRPLALHLSAFHTRLFNRFFLSMSFFSFTCLLFSSLQSFFRWTVETKYHFQSVSSHPVSHSLFSRLISQQLSRHREMYHRKCLAVIFYFLLIIIASSHGQVSSSSSPDDDNDRNSTSLQIKRGVKKLLRLQFIRNRIFNQLRINRSLIKDELADSSSFATFLTSNDNLQFDTISDSDKFNQIIPIVNLSSTVYVSTDGKKNFQIIARCIRGIGKVDNISSLLSRSDTSADEFHLYFPPSPSFRSKTSHTNCTIKKVYLKLYRKQSNTLDTNKYSISIYRIPIISLGNNSPKQPAIILDTQNINENHTGWYLFDLTNFYLSSSVYEKLVNSLIIVNATDIHDNRVNMGKIFDPADCDLDPGEDADAVHQPTLELKEQDQ